MSEPPAAWTAIAATWSYALLTGLAPPACRASVMATAVLLGRALLLEAPWLNVLSLALVVGLVLEPDGLSSPGFQLTFAATAAILGLAPRIWKRLPARPAALWRLLAVSLAAQVGVLPLAAWHFQRVTPLAAVGSLVAVPAAGLILVGSALTAALSPLAGWASEASAWMVKLGVELVFRVANTRGLDLSWRVPSPPWWVLAVYAAALVAALSPALAVRRGRALLCWTLFGLALVMVLLAPLPARRMGPGGMAVHLLDVGQGDAVLVEGPEGGRLLMDGGGSTFSEFDVGEYVLAPALLAQRIRRLDVVVLSHAHPDHAEGVLTVLRQFPVGELWVGTDPPGDPLYQQILAAAAQQDTPVRKLVRGRSLDWDGLRVQVLNPAAGADAQQAVSNNASVVLRLVMGGRAFLLTGDIHREVERELLQGEYQLAADLLKVPHHGSRSSSTPAFLLRVRPRAAFISCGLNNRYGLPDASVLRNLERAGARIYRTDRDGMLSLWTDGQRLRFDKYRWLADQ
jgi:competence protein ComEC